MGLGPEPTLLYVAAVCMSYLKTTICQRWFRNATVQTGFRLVTAVTITKIICGIECDILIVIFNN